MRQDYSDAPGTRGIEVMTQEQLNALVQTADASTAYRLRFMPSATAASRWC